jgi:hypothetical protein
MGQPQGIVLKVRILEVLAVLAVFEKMTVWESL